MMDVVIIDRMDEILHDVRESRFHAFIQVLHQGESVPLPGSSQPARARATSLSDPATQLLRDAKAADE